MKLKQVLLIIGISAASSLGSLAIYNNFSGRETAAVGVAKDGLPVNYAGFFDGKTGSPAEGLDFTRAANAAVPAVVHIKTKIPAQTRSNNLPRRNRSMDDFFDEFFGPGYGPNV